MVLLIALAGGVLVVGALRLVASMPPIEQPIRFDHQKHAGKLGFACVTCHESVKTHLFAGVPQLDTCLTCHSIIKRMSAQRLARKPELAKLKQYVSVGHIPWNRVYRQPDYVFFSHRRHVTVARIECATCHGDMKALSAPPPRPLVNQSMDWCIGCHEQRHASQDCISCHK